MKKILLPTDFSENSWNAIEYALQLFENEQCTFYVLHTYTPIIFQVDYVPMGPARFGLGDAIREVAEAKMEKLLLKINKHHKNPNHTFETNCLFSTLIGEIRDIVEKESIDYVVMGTKGATGAKQILFGSNTVQAFKNASCPVLAIPDHFKFEPPSEILFPNDFEVEIDSEQLRPILNITKLHESRLNIVHVSYGYSLSEFQLNTKAVIANELSEVSHVFHDIRNDDLNVAIDEFQEQHKTDMLVMLNNKHSFFENIFFKSTIKQIGFHVKVPFLVIPSTYKKQ